MLVAGLTNNGYELRMTRGNEKKNKYKYINSFEHCLLKALKFIILVMVRNGLELGVPLAISSCRPRSSNHPPPLFHPFEFGRSKDALTLGNGFVVPFWRGRNFDAWTGCANHIMESNIISTVWSAISF